MPMARSGQPGLSYRGMSISGRQLQHATLELALSHLGHFARASCHRRSPCPTTASVTLACMRTTRSEQARSAGRVRWFLIAILALGALLGACSRAAPGPEFFLESSSSDILLVEWSAPNNGQAVGSLTVDQSTGTGSNRSLDTTTAPLQVSINGSSVTLTPSGVAALSGLVITGTLKQGSLTISVPPTSGSALIDSTTLVASNSGSYNADVAAMRKQIHESDVAAATHERNAAALQTLDSDLSELDSDADFTGALATLAVDVHQIGSDVGMVRHDASEGPNGFGNGDCYQIEEVVDYDVTETLDYDATESFGYDLDTFERDVATAQSDIAGVDAALATVAEDGLTAPQDANSELSAAHAAISSAVREAKADIATVNHAIVAGYAIANGIATGSCSGDGPGSPPAPISPVS